MRANSNDTEPPATSVASGTHAASDHTMKMSEIVSDKQTSTPATAPLNFDQIHARPQQGPYYVLYRLFITDIAQLVGAPIGTLPSGNR